MVHVATQLWLLEAVTTHFTLEPDHRTGAQGHHLLGPKMSNCGLDDTWRDAAQTWAPPRLSFRLSHVPQEAAGGYFSALACVHRCVTNSTAAAPRASPRAVWGALTLGHHPFLPGERVIPRHFINCRPAACHGCVCIHTAR